MAPRNVAKSNLYRCQPIWQCVVSCHLASVMSRFPLRRHSFEGLAGVPLVEGADAFCFGGFSAFGLRTSLFDFFWLLAMVTSPARVAP